MVGGTVDVIDVLTVIPADPSYCLQRTTYSLVDSLMFKSMVGNMYKLCCMKLVYG
jgi:hypothetical protein